MTRIPLVEPENLTPEQFDRYQNSPSGKLSLSRLLAHARTMGPHFGEMIRAMMSDIDIPPVDRELIILATLHLDRGEYEWAQHLQVAASMGIPEEKVDAIAEDRFGSAVFSEREKAILAFTRQVVKSVRVDDFVFAAISAHFTPRQLVETIHVIGIYMLILRVSEVAELEIDGVLGAAVWKESSAS